MPSRGAVAQAATAGEFAAWQRASGVAIDPSYT
jgi:hypothetical protein